MLMEPEKEKEKKTDDPKVRQEQKEVKEKDISSFSQEVVNEVTSKDSFDKEDTQSVVSSVRLYLTNLQIPYEYHDRIVKCITSKISQEVLEKGVDDVKENIDKAIEGTIKLEKEKEKNDQDFLVCLRKLQEKTDLVAKYMHDQYLERRNSENQKQESRNEPENKTLTLEELERINRIANYNAGIRGTNISQS